MVPMSSLQAPLLTLMSIPSPSNGVWHVGPVPIRGYALCIILGIVLAIWIGERRWVARGGTAGEVSDLANWELYFGEGRNPVTALYVWRGGLGIWGAIALGALGVWTAARLRGREEVGRTREPETDGAEERETADPTA